MSATWLVTGVAIFFAGMGGVALVRPERVLACFGVPHLTADGRNEVRAVYGGFGIAIAVVLVAALALPSLRSGVLLAVAAALFGMASGRLVSRAIEGRAGFYPWLFFGVELVLGGALLLALGATP